MNKIFYYGKFYEKNIKKAFASKNKISVIVIFSVKRLPNLHKFVIDCLTRY
jgi:hypothetical protein